MAASRLEENKGVAAGKLNTRLKACACLILTAGALLLGYSLSLTPYADNADFQKRIDQMQDGDEQQYYETRQSLLSPKYKLQDYGITMLFLGLCLLMLVRPEPPVTPRSMTGFVAVAIATPSLQAATCAVDLILALSRQEYPWWTDAANLPLDGLPILFALGLIWALAHLLFLRDAPRANVPLRLALSPQANWWLLFEAGVAASLMLIASAYGAYLYAMPFLFWLYFFLSLAAKRRSRQMLETPAL